MQECLIYGLTDPRTGSVRYIGKSRTGLRRSSQHQGRPSEKNPHKSRWIMSLKIVGLAYGVVVLERVVSASDLDDAERRWIAYGRKEGWPLTNLTDGGSGGACGTWTQERRKKVADARRARGHSPETRAKLSANKKAISSTPEGKAHLARMCEAARAVNVGKKCPHLGEHNRTPEKRAALSRARLGKKRPGISAWFKTERGRAHQTLMLERVAEWRRQNASPRMRINLLAEWEV